MARKLIGEILREHGKVTEDQVIEALQRQTLTEDALGRILFDMGLVTDDDILRAWGEQIDAEIVDLTDVEVPPDVVEKLPRELAEEYHVFPIKCRGDVLVLAMSDPLDGDDLAEIAAVCKCEIETVVGSVLGITEAIERHYR